jgi:hypothetical protein
MQQALRGGWSAHNPVVYCRMVCCCENLGDMQRVSYARRLIGYCSGDDRKVTVSFPA